MTLGTSAPPAKPAGRRSFSRRTAAAATPVAETPPDAKADEEAPGDVGRRVECGVRAEESLLGRAQKESREVARRRPAVAPPMSSRGKSTDRGLSEPTPRSQGRYRARGG